MSGGDSKPKPEVQKTKQVEKGTSETQQNVSTAGTVTPTLDPEIEAGLKSQFGQYLAASGQFGEGIEDWEAAGFTPDQLQGFEMQRQAAQNMQTPLDELMRTASGDYLYGGEGFNAAVDAAYRAGVPQTLSQFGGAGRDSNFLGKANLNQIYSDAFSKYYNDERARQQAAAFGLPGLSLLPGQTYADIGKQQQALEQYGMNYPLESLYPQYASMLAQATGMATPFLGESRTGNTTGMTSGKTWGVTRGIGEGTPSYSEGSPMAGAIGGGLAGLQMGAMTGNPYIALAGAGVGAASGGGLFG